MHEQREHSIARWRVVGAASIGLFLGFSTFMGIVFGLFIKPLSSEFGWSRTQISLALTISTALVIILAPVLGRFIDNYGARRILIPSILAFGLVVGSMSLMTASLIHLYLMFVLIPIIGIPTIPASYTRIVLDWFDKDRGLALGITLSGVGLGAVIMPPVLQYLITDYGWRAAYLGFGILVLFINFPIAFFFLKEKPESPVSPTQAHHSEQAVMVVSGPGFSLSESLKRRAFWILIFTFFLLGMATLGVSAHLHSSLTDKGETPGQAALSLSVLGGFLIIARVVCGYLVDRYFAPIIASIFLMGMAIGIGILGLSTNGGLTLLAVALLGLGFGAEFDLMAYLISRYLGLRSYGQLFGFTYAAFSAGAAIGPLVMGQVFDVSGSYFTGFILFAVVGAVSAGMMLLLGPYPAFKTTLGN